MHLLLNGEVGKALELAVSKAVGKRGAFKYTGYMRVGGGG